MLTVKVGCYTKENVDELLDSLRKALACFHSKNCMNCGCKYCSSKLPCGDLTRAIEYLEQEQTSDYPHCLRVHKS